MKESVLLRGRKLLLADDSLAIQKVIELTFEDEGMQVVSVGDGKQAVARLTDVRPDVVLADVFMPELNGYEVCEQIKRDERFRHIPVILLVGSFEPFNEAEARRVGADDYLTKPFQSIRQMVSKVGSLLSGHKSDEDATNTQELPVPPAQSKTESRTQPDNLELTTADTAPLPHHLRADAQADDEAQPKSPFADLQLDDEMIEETPADNFGHANPTMGISHQRATDPLSTQDLAEVGLKPAAAAALGQQPSPSSANVLADKPREDAVIEQAPVPMRNAPRAATAGDDALLDLDDVEIPRSSAMDEADDFILDLQDASEAQPQAAPFASDFSSSFESATPDARANESLTEADFAQEMTEAAPQADRFAEAQASVEEPRAEFAFAEEQPPPAGEFHFYQQSATPVTEAVPEMQTNAAQAHEPIELPPPTYTSQTPETALSFETEPTPARDEAADAPALQASPSNQTATSQPGQIGLEQLSPEAIEAIARRVVEQLSARVVEQIAWEVVPPLAELLIKQRLEEEKSSNQ